MSNVAFITDQSLASLFESFGIDTFILEEKSDPRPTLENLVKKGYQIIYILERLAAGFIDTIDGIRKEAAVSISILPDHMSDLGLGMSLTRRATIDAIGTDSAFTKDLPAGRQRE